jgi:hypothetical protein
MRLLSDGKQRKREKTRIKKVMLLVFKIGELKREGVERTLLKINKNKAEALR